MWRGRRAFQELCVAGQGIRGVKGSEEDSGWLLKHFPRRIGREQAETDCPGVAVPVLEGFWGQPRQSPEKSDLTSQLALLGAQLHEGHPDVLFSLKTCDMLITLNFPEEVIWSDLIVNLPGFHKRKLIWYLCSHNLTVTFKCSKGLLAASWLFF